MDQRATPLQYLILGDGNMSYSYNMFLKLRSSQHPFFLTATSFDTPEELQKYPGVNNYLQMFQNHPDLSQYYGGINACDIINTLSQAMSSSPDPHQFQFDSITFNNPHIGVEDLYRHISLLSHFFHSASAVLTSHGQIIVTLCDDQPSRWELLQCAYQNGFLCYAAVELTSAEWPYFQNKRHQNDTAFPYNKMIQYFFMRRSALVQHPQLTDFVSHLFSPIQCENSHHNHPPATNPAAHEPLTQPTPTTTPAYLHKWDMAIWHHYALSLLPSQTSPSSQTPSATPSDQLTNPPLPTTHLTNPSTPLPPLRSANFGNWASTDESFIPIFQLLQPEYAYYSPLQPLPIAPSDKCSLPSNAQQGSCESQQSNNQTNPENDQNVANITESQSAQTPLQSPLQPSPAPAFTPLLTFEHAIAAYKLQQLHLSDPTAFNTYITQIHSLITKPQHQHQASRGLDQPSTAPPVENGKPQKKEQKAKQPVAFTSENLALIQQQLSIVPPGTELPPQFDPYTLGRPLTQREIVKLERFLQRNPSTEKKQQKHAKTRERFMILQSQSQSQPQHGPASTFAEQEQLNDDDDKQSHDFYQSGSRLTPPQSTSLTNAPSSSSSSSSSSKTTHPTHSTQPQFICSQCPQPRSFQTNEDLDKHVKIKHNAQMESFLLPNAPSEDLIRIPVAVIPINSLNTFPERDQSPTPIPLHSPLNPNAQHHSPTPTHSQLVCTICNIKFPTEESIQKHFKLLVPPQTALNCPHCAKLCTNQRAMIQHIALKHGNE